MHDIRMQGSYYQIGSFGANGLGIMPSQGHDHQICRDHQMSHVTQVMDSFDLFFCAHLNPYGAKVIKNKS